nr:hypothetical protein [Moritella viscosa]SHO17750.1 Putative uncharacterized protein [Moritella viscosa]
MRDFNNDGDMNIGRDLNIYDNSQQVYKSFYEMTNEELFNERPFREGNIEIEQERKVKRLKPFYGLAVILFIIAAFLSWFNGKTDLITLFIGAGSLFIGFVSLKETLVANSFQEEEQEAVILINKILKKRRAE